VLPIGPLGSTGSTSSTIFRPTFDYNALANFFTSGAAFGQTTHAEILRNGPLKDIIARDRAGVIAPWQRRQAPVDPRDLTQFLRSKPAIDLKDPQVDLEGASDDFKNLFALYKGLTLLRDMSETAQTNRTALIALDRQMQRYTGEVRSFVDGLSFSGIKLLSGLRSDTLSSTVQVPAKTAIDGVFGLTLSEEFVGGIASTARSDAIAGLTTSDSFTIDVTNSSGTQSIAISLSGVSGTLNIDNVVDHINSELVAAGVTTSLQVERLNEFAYAIKVKLGSGETVEFKSPGSSEAAVYAAGTYGAGTSADGFVTKLDDLASTDPNSAFLETVHTDAADSANGVAVDSKGNVYVVGGTEGDLDGQGEVGAKDAYLSKYDGSGNLLYTVRLGATGTAGGFAVAVDSSDNVIVAGQTTSPLTDTAYGGNTDTFVTKFDSTGKELFTRQASPYADDGALGLTVDSSGNIFVSGVTNSAIATDQTHLGGRDAFVTKLDNNGNLVYNQQFGGSGDDHATAVTVDNAGNIFVTANVASDAVVRKYADSSSSTPTFEVNLGALGSDGGITGIARDSDGELYVTGYTTNAGLAGTIDPANTHSGGTDAFVTRITDNGSSATVGFTSYLGSAANDRAYGIAVNSGNIYVTGQTEGSIGGETQIGTVDGFVAKLENTTGNLQYVHQFGGGLDYRGTSIAFDSDGTSVLSRLGLVNGTVPVRDADDVTVAMETTARVGQSFYISIDGGARKQITIESTDTMDVLAARISNILGTKGDAKMADNGSTEFLQIQARSGAVLEIGAGPEGFDALAGLGLKPALLIGDPADAEDAEAEKDATFELGIIDGLSLLTKEDAVDATVIFDNAMLELRKAFRFLTEGPPPDDPFEGVVGPPPRFLASRIAAFEFALQRLQVVGPSAGLGIVV
jgi:hypothetical protein